MRQPRLFRGEGGISLIDVTVSAALFGVVVAAFGPLLTRSIESTDAVQNESRAIDEIRVAVSRLDSELRSAECISAPAAGSSGSTLTFRTLAGNGGAYSVTYRVAGDELLRDEGTATSVVGEGLVTNGAEFRHTANAGQRASVAVNLQVRFEAGHDPRAVQTSIAGRNAWEAC